MTTPQQRTVDNKADIAFYDQLHLLSSDHIRETVSDQWDDRVLTDEELAHIMENIADHIYGFLYDEISEVIGTNV